MIVFSVVVGWIVAENSGFFDEDEEPAVSDPIQNGGEADDILAGK